MWVRMLLAALAVLVVIWSVAVPGPNARAAPTPEPTEPPPRHRADDVAPAPLRDAVVAADRATSPPTETTPAVVRDTPMPRTVRVLDESSWPVAGAVVATDATYRADGQAHYGGGHAVTDGSGRATLMVRPGQLLSVCAPGFRLLHDYVPEAAGEWVLVLPRALRLVMSILGTSDFAGLQLRVLLPRDCPVGPFYQSRYVQTPGRAVADTVARWTHDPSRALPFWDVGIPPTGTAVLDQIEGTGEVTVQLRRFGAVLDERHFAIEEDREVVRLQFTITPTAALHGIVVDSRGTARPDVLLRMAPYGGIRIVDSPTGVQAFPVWAPSVRSDGAGRFVLPRPDRDDERIVVTCPGYAARAVTIAEVDAAGGRIELAAGHTVRIEIRDCNGKPLDGGYSTSAHHYEEPGVLLGHDVWRGTGDKELPWFEFAELPPAMVTFRCAGEDLRHDARVPYARLITEGPVELMGIGK